MFSTKMARRRFIFKHLKNRDEIIWQIHLTSQPAHGALRRSHEVAFIYIYLCVCLCAEAAKCLHQVVVSWSYYWKKMTDMNIFFFFLYYRYKINEVLQLCAKPITWSVGLKFFAIKLLNACVNILFYLNNLIMDWISIGQRLALVWEILLCPWS